ncbi:MAG TPA: carboxy terminal-processing peptidase [Chitinophagaceae bacterium]|nr:carboxy terminal-processing peptidase [Chitinophagaceae bacterium]
MKRLPILVMMLVAVVFLAFQTMGTGKSNPPSKYEKILQSVSALLTQGHFSPKEINDAFSKKIFAKYFTQLDANKNIFLQSDIDSLRKYETRIDDELKGAPVEFFLAAGRIFDRRAQESAAICQDILSRPFDFTVDETVVTDPDKLDFPKTDAARREMWRKKLKLMTLERYSDLLDMRDKNKGREGFVVKTNEQLEKEAREKVLLAMNRIFDHYRYKFDDDDKFDVFVNTITQSMDPYTEFFPPVEKRYFDEQMSGSFYGIGASLLYDETKGSIKINSLVTGSPAWKSGDVEVGDIIVSVAQGKSAPVDLTGYMVEDAVKLIRGEKGTEVRLTLRKGNGSLKTVSLIRDKIVQEETFARSAIIKNGNEKIGYIYLPEFYADFEHANGSRCSVDVAKEVTKLKEQKVDGIVIDLRNNGGGSLYDVVQMAGLFIEDGPIVQVKDRYGNPSILKDKDRSVLYDGPLAVMVNEFSASASEIFAAAIQDYHRGVIIGSTSTYGKGTVQRNIGLDPENGFSESNSDLGTVKLTLQKFYRINGGSTQLKGVASDVVLPDNLEYLKVRERDNEEALPWDEITKAAYTPWNSGYDLKNIEAISRDRVKNDVAFQTIQQNTQWLASQNDKEYSLQLDKYRKEQAQIAATVKQNETLMKLTTPMAVSYLPQDQNRFDNDKDKQTRFNQWLKNLSTDIYLDQAVKTMNDMISQRNIALGISKPADQKKAF